MFETLGNLWLSLTGVDPEFIVGALAVVVAAVLRRVATLLSARREVSELGRGLLQLFGTPGEWENTPTAVVPEGRGECRYVAHATRGVAAWDCGEVYCDGVEVGSVLPRREYRQVSRAARKLVAARASAERAAERAANEAKALKSMKGVTNV